MSEEDMQLFYEFINGTDIVGKLEPMGRELIKNGVKELQQKANALDELEEWLLNEKHFLEDIPFDAELTIEAQGRLEGFREILSKIQELKGAK